MSNRICILLGLLLGLLPDQGFGQMRAVTDSVLPATVSDTLNVKRFGFRDWVYGGEGEYVSNTLDGTHDYYPLYSSSLVRNDLGNIGSADRVILYDRSQPFGFNFRSSRKGYWKNTGERSILLSDRMFSNVYYVNGANRENYLQADLTRSFGELLSAGFSFNRINSLGFYARQQNIVTDISIFTAFRGREGRYRAVAMFDYSSLKADENGGLLSDSIFENNVSTGRNFIPTALASSNNLWKGLDIGLEQRFFLLKEDSTKQMRPLRPAISHSFSTSRSSMIHSDIPDTAIGFYENIYLDSALTYDSTNLLGVTNTVRFEVVRSDSADGRGLNRLAVGIKHEYYRVAYDSIVERINNLAIVGNAEGVLLSSLNWNAEGNFMVYGYNIWDMKLDGGLTYRFRESELAGYLTYSLYRPDHITDSYRSNNFEWDNTWVQTQHLRTGVRYEQKKLRFKGSLTYHLLDNPVVFGTDRLPFQSSSINQLIVLRMTEHFRMRWFHVVLDGAMQTILSGDDIRIPLALGRGLLYYQNDIFKRKLRLQIGAEANYSTAFYANAYNPALSAFYLQNDRLTGNYPFVDLFLNLRIKKFKAFFKVEHFNAGMLGYSYYLVPHYPANDLAWKFGINWAFFD